MSTQTVTDSLMNTLNATPEAKAVLIKSLDERIADLQAQRDALADKPVKAAKRVKRQRVENEITHKEAVLLALKSPKKGLTTADLFDKIVATGHKIGKATLAQVVLSLTVSKDGEEPLVVKDPIDPDAAKPHYRYRLNK